MSAAIQNLLDRAGGCPGLMAAGVFANDQRIVSRALDPAMREPDLLEVWQHLSEAMEVTQHHGMPPAQMRWIFERVLIYCVKRNDGLHLGLIFGRESAPPMNQELLESVIDKFKKLHDV